jgi:hypothetical protein
VYRCGNDRWDDQRAKRSPDKSISHLRIMAFHRETQVRRLDCELKRDTNLTFL